MANTCSPNDFYWFSKIDGRINVNMLVSPCYPFPEEYHESFLVYAESEEDAFNLAMEHIHEGRKMDRFYGTYKGESYDGIRCVMR